jgi:hypothetical protein
MSISLDTLKEYIVTLHKFDDLESFYADMETEGGLEYIPNRRVDCHIRRPVSRNTHYMLTDEEALALRLDPRVLDVELTMEELGIITGPAGSYTTSSNRWSKSASLSQGDLNWGLFRVFNGSQVSNWGFDGTQNVSGTITMPQSGSNVDVVIVDGMLDPAHPEFAVNSTGTGGSRVIQYNWYSLNPTVTGGSTSTYLYVLDNTSETDKHATHVAGIAVGNTQGWARDANIYNISPGYVTGGVSNTYLYDYIKVWHETKLVNPLTGVKNPTITNNSWQSWYSTAYTNVTSVTYRGTTTTKSFTKAELNAYGIYIDASNNAFIPTRNTALDADIADLIAAGVIFVACAGNYYTKMDVLGGVDYNNYVVVSGTTTVYTNRGSSPGSATGALCVGSTGAGVTSGGDRKASYSNCGPRIDIWAPGTFINSSWVGSAPAAGFANPALDVRNSSYYVGKLNGTSMASPQVAGLLACLLEKVPTINQATAMQVTTSTYGLAASGQIPSTTGGPTDYFDLQGAPNLHLAYFPNMVELDPISASKTLTATVPTSSFIPFTNAGGFGAKTWNINPAISSGLTFNPINGGIKGTPKFGSTSTYYNITVTDSLSYQSTGTFTLTILPFKEITTTHPWENTGTIGTLVPGEISELYVKGNFSTSTVYLNYLLTDGALPAGLTLNRDGTISGRADSNPGLTNVVLTSTCVISVTDTNNNNLLNGRFSINVNQTDNTQYTEIYCRPFLPQDKRSEFLNFIRNEEIFIPELLYRPLDPYFGKQQDLKLVIDFGVKRLSMTDYANIVSTNFYRRKIALGELKTAVAKNSDGTVKHEIIYVDIIDKHVNSNKISVPTEITFNGNTYYPPSIANMREKFASETVVTSIRNPSFTKFVQAGDATKPGYIPFVPLCFTLPGRSATVIRKINESGFKFNTFNFEIDRLIVENSTGPAGAKYLLLNRSSRLA